MLAARYVYILALVAWLGGMLLAAGVVAPVTFSVLEGAAGSRGRILAGEVFGTVLDRLQLLGLAAGVLMLLSLTLQRIVGPRPAAYGVRAGVIAAMLAVTAYATILVAPRIEILQRSVDGPMNTLPADDQRRVEFDRLHGRSSTLVGLAAAGGLVLLVWEAREPA